MKDPFLTQIMIDRYKRTLIDLIERKDRILYKQITSGYGLTPFEERELREIKSWIWNVKDQINMLNTWTI